MAQPSTPGPTASTSLFGPPMTHVPSHQDLAIASQASSTSSATAAGVSTPASAASSNNTYIMPNSPMKNRNMMDGYRPKVTRTLGQRPACLVNASVTYCGNNQIYAFGGFDQYTDEVYNHVLKLDLVSHQWSLVDNYGDIPGVRMGMNDACRVLQHQSHDLVR
jgi:Galactose oxidase, central domain